MEKDMRILLLTQAYPPILGGIEHHVQSLGAELAARGHQVAVATFRYPGQAEAEMDGAVKIYHVRGTMQRFSGLFTTGRFHAPPLPDPELMLALRQVIKEERPEIIHAHNWIVHSFLPLKQWSKAKLVMSLHDSEMSCVQMRYMYMDHYSCSGPGPVKCLRCSVHHYGPLKGAVTLAGNYLMRGFEKSGVDVFLPVSRAVAESNGLTAQYGMEAKVRVIPNFIPDDVADVPHTDDSRLDPLPDEPFIMQAGDLIVDKGVYVLLEAYQGLKSAPPLVLIGRRTAESPSELPGQVTMIDSIPHDLVMQAWRRSLFGVVPSLNPDGSPTVTLEAMACGRPVIGSRTGGIVEQISNGNTGLLVEPGNVQALRKAMQCLVDDPDLRERMGAAARERVVEFQASTVVSKIERIYRSL
jgi:glycosyltransferase involved in cell wall biosynthesis